MIFMDLNIKKLTLQEGYRLIGNSRVYQTSKAYISIVKRFLKSGKTLREFSLSYSNKSRSTMRSVYFALKFFYENVLDERFDEKLPLAKKSLKPPVVSSKEEINKMMGAITNIEHKPVLALLYYARLSA